MYILQYELGGVSDIHEACPSAQELWRREGVARDRPRLRESNQIKELRCKVRCAVDEPSRVPLLAELVAARRHLSCTFRRLHQVNKFSIGAGIVKRKKLYNISSMINPGSETESSVNSSSSSSSIRPVAPSSDPSDWTVWLTAEYASKWRADDELRLRAAKEFLCRTDGVNFDCTTDEICFAFPV